MRFGTSNKADGYGDVPLIQGKDFTKDGALLRNGIAFTETEGLKPRDYLQAGEILFSAKGHRRYAVCWQGELESAVASLTFLVLTVTVPALLPEYLTLYLNSKMAHQYFAEHERGTSIPIISRSILDNLTVPVPPPEVQRKVVHLHQLWLREKQLMEELSLQKEQLIQLTIQSLLKTSV